MVYRYFVNLLARIKQLCLRFHLICRTASFINVRERLYVSRIYVEMYRNSSAFPTCICNNVRQGRVHSPYWIQQRTRMCTGILLVGRLLQVVIIVISSFNMQRTFVSSRFMRCNPVMLDLKILLFYFKISTVFMLHTTILCQNNIFSRTIQRDLYS